ncbi:MAG: RNA polymerase sigma factor [Planctomycetota bacterium]|nr:RNA polymerase sigma factor [Planctomycetota bacterium]
MMSQDNECIQQLLCEARSGSRASMGHLAVIVRQRLYPFVLRTTLDPDAAEDIVQETLLSVLLEITRLREDSRFWPWVYRITWNKIQDSFRKCRLRSSGKATFALDCSGDAQPQNASVLDAKIHEERLRQVSDGVDQLSYHHRDIIRLRFYEQLSYEQIASRTRITPKMARTRSYRAKKQLKACLV